MQEAQETRVSSFIMDKIEDKVKYQAVKPTKIILSKSAYEKLKRELTEFQMASFERPLGEIHKLLGIPVEVDKEKEDIYIEVK